jgi:hypothetical protein
MSCAAIIESTRVVPGINENLKTYLVVVAMVIFSLVVIYFTFKMSPNVMSSYLKDEIGELGKFDFEDILDTIEDIADYMY